MPRNPHRSTLPNPRFLRKSRVAFDRILILPGISFYPEDYRTVGEPTMTDALEAIEGDAPPPVALYEGFVLNPRLHKNENGRIYAAYYQSKLSLIPFEIVTPSSAEYIKLGLERLRQRGRLFPDNQQGFNDAVDDLLQRRRTIARPGDWFAPPPLDDEEGRI